MTARINSFMENHPALGWIGSVLSCLTGALQWFIDHVDTITKLVGLGTVLLGLMAGYYTFRIQRRTFKKGQLEDERRDRSLD